MRAILADLYDLPPLEWAAVESRLESGVTQAPDSAARTGTPAG